MTIINNISSSKDLNELTAIKSNDTVNSNKDIATSLTTSNTIIELLYTKLEYKHIFLIYKYDVINFNKQDCITIKEYIKWFIDGLFGFMLFNKHNNELIGYILYESNISHNYIDIYIASIVVVDNYKRQKFGYKLLLFLINKILDFYKNKQINFTCKIRTINIPSIKLFSHNKFIIYDTKNNWHYLKKNINN
jgi:GNAT superfamily N-acetyltransferase